MANRNLASKKEGKRSGSAKKDKLSAAQGVSETEVGKHESAASQNPTAPLQISSRADSKVSPTKAERLAGGKNFLSPSNAGADGRSRD